MGFLIDLHCHTLEHSYDGKVPAKEILAGLLQANFSGLVFTEHNYVWSDEELAELRRECNVPEDFLLLSGHEVRTMREGVTHGDLLVYGPREAMPDGVTPREVLEASKRSNGFTIAAHASVPFIGFGQHLGEYPVDAVETWNGRYGAKVASESRVLARRNGLPETGGSDTHKPGDIGGGATEFPELPRSFEDLRRLIREGECRPWRPDVVGRALDWVRRLRG